MAVSGALIMLMTNSHEHTPPPEQLVLISLKGEIHKYSRSLVNLTWNKISCTLTQVKLIK